MFVRQDGCTMREEIKNLVSRLVNLGVGVENEKKRIILWAQLDRKLNGLGFHDKGHQRVR